MQRESYFDNAKFLLIALVVFGHMIRSFIEQDEVMLAIYKFIYTFHMPAFILIAGYFSKGFQKKGYVKKVATKLIVPYLIFHGIYSVYYMLVKNEHVLHVVDPLNPHWSLWFLLSLFCWNLLLYPFSKWPKGVAISIAFMLALAIGFVEEINHYMSLSRTFVFFPLFLIGYSLKREHFLALQSMRVRFLSIVTLLFILFLYFNVSFEYEWLFGSKPYAYFGEVTISSAFTRLGFYGLTLVTTFAFLALVPTRRFFFTEWGARTFYVYLLHGFIIQAFRASDLEHVSLFAHNLFFTAIIAFAITLVLSSNWVYRFAKPLIEIQAIAPANRVRKRVS
ncbi:acyltransferase family protein [Bacillus kexueae]|uniref:acyltransferase family protein n=1 Tax=Aeribacillus kexueae TaxID=2078952 RepID=UPI001FB03D9A|nr:acyltransferase family protein [Bacillus kexueae]